MMENREALEKFLGMDMSSATPVLEEFAKLPNATWYKEGQQLEQFVYVRGTREDKILLIAHADTVFLSPVGKHIIMHSKETDTYYSGEKYAGIGADDRAGCAMLWQLKDLGHSLLILDGEEIMTTASSLIKFDMPEIYEELNSHQYMIQLDRKGINQYKVYNIPVTEEFKQFVETEFGVREAGRGSFTDIVQLCGSICGANLSCGYYNEHLSTEYLVYPEWEKMLEKIKAVLKEKQEKFEVDQFYASILKHYIDLYGYYLGNRLLDLGRKNLKAF